MKATIETARNVAAPPGRPVMAAASVREKPDWVSAQAMPVARADDQQDRARQRTPSRPASA